MTVNDLEACLDDSTFVPRQRRKLAATVSSANTTSASSRDPNETVASKPAVNLTCPGQPLSTKQILAFNEEINQLIPCCFTCGEYSLSGFTEMTCKNPEKCSMLNPVLESLLKLKPKINECSGAVATVQHIFFERGRKSKNTVYVCKHCRSDLDNEMVPKFSPVHGFLFGECPEELKVLNKHELRLCSKVLPFVSLSRSYGHSGQYFAKGHVMNLRQDVQEVVKLLPRSPHSAGIVLGKRSHDGARAFEFRPALIRAALEWLRQNNKYYSDITIDETQLAALQSPQQLPELQLSDDKLEPEPDTLTETFVIGEAVESVQSLKHAMADVLPSEETERVVMFPKLHEFVHEGRDTYLAMAFPRLFPFGIGDFHDVNAVLAKRATHISVTDFLDVEAVESNSDHDDTHPMDQTDSDTESDDDICNGTTQSKHKRKPGQITKLQYYRHLMKLVDGRFENPEFLFHAYDTLFRSKVQFATAKLSKSDFASLDFEVLQAAKGLLYGDQVPLSDATTLAKRILKSLRPYFSKMPGTPQQMKKFRDNLFAAISFLPAPPDYFTTFSAADTHWPQLFRCVYPEKDDEELRNMSSSQCNETLAQHPVLAALFFHRRWQAFKKHIVGLRKFVGKKGPVGEIVDFWNRVEFQLRGSPHMHCIWWLLNPLQLESHLESQTGRERIAAIADSIISAMQKDPNANLESDEDLKKVHPARLDPPIVSLHSEEAQTDISHCMKAFQTHKHTDHCQPKTASGKLAAKLSIQRKRKAKQADLNTNDIDDTEDGGYCRHEFPKRIQQHTTVEVEKLVGKTRRMRVHFERNDAWTVECVLDFLRTWRANSHIALIGHAYGAAQYMSGYASKHEPTGNLLKEVETALSRLPAASPMIRQLNAATRALTAKRQISAQEAAFHVLGFPIVESNFQVETVFVFPQNERQYPLNSSMKPGKDIMHCYERRPPLLEPFSLSDFVSAFRRTKTKIPLNHSSASSSKTKPKKQKQKDVWASEYDWPPSCEVVKTGDAIVCDRVVFAPRKKPAIVMPIPKYPADETDENYCRSFLTLNVPFRNPRDLYEPNESAVEALQRHLSHQERSRLVTQFNEEQFKQQIEQDIVAQEQLDRNEVANVESSDHEFEVDMAENNVLAESHKFAHWKPVRAHPSNLWEVAQDFLKHQKAKLMQNLVSHGKSSMFLSPKTLSPQMMQSLETLSASQRQFFDSFVNLFTEQQYRSENWASRLEHTPAYSQMILTGGAGCGKTHALNLVCQYVKEHSVLSHENEVSTAGHGKAIKLATTGVAALLIQGMTYHSALKIGTFGSGTLGTSQANTILELSASWQETDVIILDEFSMLSQDDLRKINERLNQIFGIPSNSHMRFGGKIMIFSGDFHQLAPVKGQAIYKSECTLWNDITNVTYLSEVKRQTGEANAKFLDLLSRVSKGKATVEDEQLLKSRVIPRSHMMLPLWRSAPRIFPTNDLVDDENAKALSAMPNRILLWAAHFASRKSKVTDVDRSELLQPKKLRAGHDNSKEALLPLVEIAIGCKVVLTRNISVELGLVNGAPGTLYDIIPDPLKPFRPQLSRDDVTHDDSCVSFPCLLVKFDPQFYRGDSILSSEPGVVPIFATRTPNLRCNGKVFSRRQFPVRLGYATTIHSCQGQTLERALVSLSKVFVRSQAFVALSRVKEFDNLGIIDSDFSVAQLNYGRAQHSGKSNSTTAQLDFSCMLKEVQRLMQCSQSYSQLHSPNQYHQQDETSTGNITSSSRCSSVADAASSSKKRAAEGSSAFGLPPAQKRLKGVSVGDKRKDTLPLRTNAKRLKSSINSDVSTLARNSRCVCLRLGSSSVFIPPLSSAPWLSNDCLPMSFAYILMDSITRHQLLLTATHQSAIQCLAALRSGLFLSARMMMYEEINDGAFQRTQQRDWYKDGDFLSPDWLLSDFFHMRTKIPEVQNSKILSIPNISLSQPMKCHFASCMFSGVMHFLPSLIPPSQQKLQLAFNTHVPSLAEMVECEIKVHDSAFLRMAADLRLGDRCPSCKHKTAFPSDIPTSYPLFLCIDVSGQPSSPHDSFSHICQAFTLGPYQYRLIGVLHYQPNHFYSDFAVHEANRSLWFRYDPWTNNARSTTDTYLETLSFSQPLAMPDTEDNVHSLYFERTV